LSQEIPSVSDEELARQAQAGSLAAFEELVYRYEGRIHAFVAQFCRGGADAGELTQDTFVRAFQRMAQFDSRRAFAPWLFTIARRQCIDRHRREAPRAEAPLPDAVAEGDPAELAARREDGQSLWRIARKRLGASQFQALWLHYAEDMSVAQVAQVMGKTRVHVKVLLFRARQTLALGLNRSPLLAQAIPDGHSPQLLAAVAARQSNLPPAG
jgi:RNA polymerase sigma-70 factor (ECF subfamily)